MGTLNQFKRNSKAKPSLLRARPLLVKAKIGSEKTPEPSSSTPSYTPVKTEAATPLKNKNSEIVEMNNRGVSLYNNGDFRVASSLFLEAAALRNSRPRSCCISPEEKVQQPPASSYMYQRNDFDEGMSVFVDAQDIQCDDHPKSVEASILFNAGQASRNLEDYDAALSYYRLALGALVPLFRRHLSMVSSSSSDTKVHDESITSNLIKFTDDDDGDLLSTADHKVIVPILHNLAHLAYRQGNLREAIAFYDHALTHCQRLHGPTHLFTGITLNCLGVLHYHLSGDESNKAKQYFDDALVILQKSLGEDVAAVATCWNNLGRTMVQREDYDLALVYYDKALKIREKVLGTNNIDYAATAFNAGQSLHHRREYDRAIHLYREFLRVAKLTFCQDHRDIAIVLSGIAQIHQEQKKYENALELYQESLRVGRSALGNNHSEVAMLLNRIGNFYFEREEFDAALKAYKEGLQIERKVLEKTHPNVIVTLSNIGEIHRQKGHYKKAVRLYSEAMELQKHRYGFSSAEVASALNVIGLIHDQNGDSDRAMKTLQEALVLRRMVLGDDHLDVAVTLTYLGSVFYRRNMISTALQLFTESLRIRSKKLGKDHRDVAFTLYNVGLCHQLQGNSADAVLCFEETLRVEILVLTEDHKDVSLTLHKLGEAYRAGSDLQRALDSFRRALAIERRLAVNKDDPASMARTLNEIGNVYLAKGNHVDEMMEAFIEAARLFRQAGLSIHSVSVSPGLKLYAAGFSSSAACA